MSTKKNNRQSAEERRLAEAWRLSSLAARDIRRVQVDSGAPSISDALERVVSHYERELRDPGSLCLGVVPSVADGDAHWLVDEEIDGSGPIFARTSERTPIVLISGHRNSGKSTLLHVLVEQAAAATSPHDTAIFIGEHHPQSLTARTAHLGDRVLDLRSKLRSSDELDGQKSMNLLFIDDLDLLLKAAPDWWDLITAIAGRDDVRIFATAASAVPRTLPRSIISSAVRVALQGSSLPGTSAPTAPWMFSTGTAESQTTGLCFTDLPAGTSPTGLDDPYTAPHREALALLRRGGSGAGVLRRWSVLDRTFGLGDLKLAGRRRSELAIGVVADANGAGTEPWCIDLDDAPRLAIAGDPLTGRTTALMTMVFGAALHAEGPRFLLISDDGDLEAISDLPSVAGYATAADSLMVERLIARAERVIEERRVARAAQPTLTVDEFLAGRTSDPHHRLVLAIDGIGAFLGEDRSERAQQLLTIADNGPDVGVHLVFTADSAGGRSTGNHPHYAIEAPVTLQLCSRDYSQSRLRPEIRVDLDELIPRGKPGWSVDAKSGLPARIAFPSARTEPTAESPREQIAHAVKNLQISPRGFEVPRVNPAPDTVSLEDLWSAICSAPVPAEAEVALSGAALPLGVDLRTDRIIGPEGQSAHLLIYGAAESGRSTAALTAVESAAHLHGPSDMAVYVLDPRGDLSNAADGLRKRGYLRPEKTFDSGRVRPSGYARTPEQVETAVSTLEQLMAARRRTAESTTSSDGDVPARPNPEVFVVIDNFNAMTSGYARSSALDRLVPLISSGTDLGVRFIVTDNADMSTSWENAPFLGALAGCRHRTLLQLSGSPNTSPPFFASQHLRPRRWAPGRGRMIVAPDDYATIQVALPLSARGAAAA
ncbi:Type VII secretion system protein EccCb1 (plasmid) [Tsukamurella tyrosinosolvens]|uniref:FtsK/SpoIIIE family protein n=1 Tax=Tsukamurella tyrosinosolvens TaxID=57704 RepID=A0A1H4UX07_TSUTY|nr:FtsK/SpoIIIE domain-containing protein [Tsukamurella tyrosinosolvens]KXO98410.1 hypothetical protein AXK58_25390 [Tsukamurella tyrosinosolvens]SEC73267.1 FtsK/SpoIIIE family protein [Tsukamurella tyrosinosolvens]VEH90827.1 Type VII secretion system protein EccCb1 [Tsukamurella tyrosinosolvens]